jgi:ABC-type phosphate transport system substrate-binding protein
MPWEAKAMATTVLIQKWIQGIRLGASASIAGRLAPLSILILMVSQLQPMGWAQGVSANETIALRGAGSTFSAPLYKKWIEEYGVLYPNITLSYDVVGSGEGVKRFLSEAVDFRRQR